MKSWQAVTASNLVCGVGISMIWMMLGAWNATKSEDDFTDRERKKILSLSPVPPTPSDPTNQYADVPKAAHFRQFLFFDPRMSGLGKVSCATCHDPQRTFTDGKALVEGEGIALRNSPTLLNTTQLRWFFWDGRADTLWSQALEPIENEREMNSDRVHVVRLVGSDPELRVAYESIFGEWPDALVEPNLPDHARPVMDEPNHPLNLAWLAMPESQREAVTRVFVNVGKAIDANERRLRGGPSDFDRYVKALRSGAANAETHLPESALQGLALFIGKANCRFCHHGPMLSDGEFHNTEAPPNPDVKTVDTGRYEGVKKLLHSPFNASGKYSDAPRHTNLRQGAELWGQFKTPSLRNVALTAPYMHQGQYASLHVVIRFYSTREDAIPNGHHQEQILLPLNLSHTEIDALVDFLESLTEEPPALSLRTAPGSPRLSKDSD
ncbi:MAG: hypothetical protein O7G85_08165 [Planctomycetota bacterium]|nr:hypothetical protein [Planctomycetota bacterium]